MHDFTKITIAIFVIAALALGGYFVYDNFLKSEVEEIVKTETAETVSIPDEILNNKYGFLSGGGGMKERNQIKSFGAKWTRPHPGPFLWEMMQESETAEISFTGTDEVVKANQEAELGTLATLWPFADWDQKRKTNPEQYKVARNDEFLRREKDKGKEEQDYLPWYRGNPHDWAAYQTWVKKVVERYDGDGVDDMPGLKIPVKYWEIVNEVGMGGSQEEEGMESSLDFYNEDGAGYAELLIKTSTVIRQANPQAKILISGAAGGSNEFMDFYREVFKNKEAIRAFDIGNVHCISSDSYDSLNVEPYKNLLQEFGIKKPIWVTEAETMISEDADVNASQLYNSVKKALSLGAERIFFTAYGFELKMQPGGGGPGIIPGVGESVKVTLDGNDPKKAYQKITGLK